MPVSILIAEAGVLTEGARAIQLALAPVFLLTGIAGLLNVMTGRLSRIIDRGRHLTEGPPSECPVPLQQLTVELRILERRRRLASSAITACTLAALLVCVVIVLLFLEVLLNLPLKWLEGALFSAATISLVVGLGYFLREVHISTQTVRIESRSAMAESSGDTGPGASAGPSHDIDSDNSAPPNDTPAADGATPRS